MENIDPDYISLDEVGAIERLMHDVLDGFFARRPKLKSSATEAL